VTLTPQGRRELTISGRWFVAALNVTLAAILAAFLAQGELPLEFTLIVTGSWSATAVFHTVWCLRRRSSGTPGDSP
jgi:hypothetical protein